MVCHCQWIEGYLFASRSNKFLTKSIESSLCGYSDAYILVTGDIAVTRAIPANIRLDEDDLRTSWRRFSSLSSEDVLTRMNMFTLAFHLQKTSSRRLQDVFKTSSKRLQDVLKNVSKTSSRRIEDVFKTSCKDIFKTFSRRIIKLNSSS